MIKATGGVDHRKFKINNTTGVITTLDSFDREDKNEYYITVVAQDGANSDRPNHYPKNTPNQGILRKTLIDLTFLLSLF